MSNFESTRSPEKITNNNCTSCGWKIYLSQEIVALIEEAIAKTAHKCGHDREDWGGTPSSNNVW
jgi:hypothetical protein